MSYYTTPENLRDKLLSLSPRQRQVIHCFCEGLNQRETAKELEIKLGTVKTHMGHAYVKLDLEFYRRTERKRILNNQVCRELSKLISEEQAYYEHINRPDETIDDYTDDITDDGPDETIDDRFDDITEDGPDEIPGDLTDDGPDDITDGRSDEIPDHPTDDITEDRPDDITDDGPDETIDDRFDDITEDGPDEIPGDITDDGPDEISGDITDDGPDEISGDITDDRLDDITDGRSDEIPDHPTDDITDDNKSNIVPIPKDRETEKKDEVSKEIIKMVDQDWPTGDDEINEGKIIKIPPDKKTLHRLIPWRVIITILVIGVCFGAFLVFFGFQVYRRFFADPITPVETLSIEDASNAPTITPIPAPTSGPKSVEPGFIFEDDFEKEPYPAWEIVSGDLGMMKGKFTVEKPFSGTRTEHLAVLSDIEWEDVSVEIEIGDFAESPGGTNAAGGIILGYKGSGDSLILIFYPGDSGIEFGTYSDGRVIPISGSLEKGDSLYRGPNLIKFEKRGNLIYGYVNNKRVTYKPITGFESGQVGLWFRNGSYKNIESFYAPRVEWIEIKALGD